MQQHVKGRALSTGFWTPTEPDVLVRRQWYRCRARWPEKAWCGTTCSSTGTTVAISPSDALTQRAWRVESKWDRKSASKPGSNESPIHVDFVVGSPQLSVYGVTGDGSEEPIIADGEWGFEV